MQNLSPEINEPREASQPFPSWLETPVSTLLSRVKAEWIIILLFILLAVISRFSGLGLRVMSHDEVNHVVPSWQLFTGSIYRHDPVTHGPLQFHLIALSYFLLGDNDFTSRLPAALFSIGAVAFVLISFRRYMGLTGAIIAGLLFLISPYLLYYGRYARNEGFIELFAVMTLYAILRYLDRGDRFSLYLLTVSLALHFTSKETSYIYTAQVLLFSAILFIQQIGRIHWPDPRIRDRFLLLVFIALVLLGIALGLAVWNSNIAVTAEPAADSSPGMIPEIALTAQLTGEILTILASLVIAIFAGFILIREHGWGVIRSFRSFDILILIGTLILPLLSAFPVKMAGFDPLNYEAAGLTRTGIVVGVFFLAAMLIGYWWQRRNWFLYAAVFYGIFVVFYTSIFTNGQGFFTGLVGSLGYWLSQQGVERGSQPWYYYGLIQVPIYEYLSALGAILALYFGIRYSRFTNVAGYSPADPINDPTDGSSFLQESAAAEDLHEIQQESLEPFQENGPAGTKETDNLRPVRVPTLALFLFWSITSLLAYSLAGEKMPWLTVHIAIPLALTGAWGFGYLVDITDWKALSSRNGILVVLLLPVGLASFAAMVGSLLGNTPPFQGKTLEQLQNTNGFILAACVFLFSCYGLVRLTKGWSVSNAIKFVTLVIVLFLTILTIRTSYRASYINYDYATEYLVYAHAAPGPKQVLAQVEEISRRLTKGLDIEVAYDNDALYPYWWYFRNYPNHRWYTDKPTRDLADAPMVIAGESTMGKMDSILRNNFNKFEYMRLWWPNQDYFNLTWERIWNAIRDPQMRTALFYIWLNRDYSLYAELTGSDSLTPETWQPSSKMVFYIRKDIVAQIWNYGVAPAVEMETETDPYLAGMITLLPDLSFGTNGSGEGQFQSPRGMTIGPDGSIYVADSRNHRVQHFTANGEFINSWGTFADVGAGNALGGTFNEPWGIDAAPDGSIYVADTWNHRIQKFTPDGKFLFMLGFFGQAESPEAFWGPRDVAVDGDGRVFVTDTGNKRVVVFNSEGQYLTQFGLAGVGLGEMDEPVGIAAAPNGNIFVAEAWNQRVQVFTPGAEPDSYNPLQFWDIYGWFGQSMENKPFIAVNNLDQVFVTDPEGYKVLQFDQVGNFIRGWGDYSTDTSGFGLPSGIATDSSGNVYVSDAENNRILRFVLPE